MLPPRRIFHEVGTLRNVVMKFSGYRHIFFRPNLPQQVPVSASVASGLVDEGPTHTTEVLNIFSAGQLVLRAVLSLFMCRR